MNAEFQRVIYKDMWIGVCTADYTDEQRRTVFEYFQPASV
jgi:hypothetical protein